MITHSGLWVRFFAFSCNWVAWICWYRCCVVWVMGAWVTRLFVGLVRWVWGHIGHIYVVFILDFSFDFGLW